MKKTVLIVDDNPMNRYLLNHTLCDEYAVLEARSGAAALEMVRSTGGSLSAVLLDIVMPGMDGYEVLRLLRENTETSGIPVIMVTGSEDEDSRTKALALGANDFILKPYNPDVIRHCVRNNIALYETARKLNAMQRDKLTGLLNREAFFEQVADMVAAHEPGQYILSSFDIDNFKVINAQFGTVEGDHILRDVGRAVQEDMNALGGIACRISGDNFAALIPAIHNDVSIVRFPQSNRLAFSNKQAVLFSVGRYLITDLSLSPSAAYDRAYIAKQSVKGRYDEHIAYFTESMLDRLIRNQQIIDDVDIAIAERQFEVWYQPQRNHVTGALVGAEALVRWRHPTRGLIPPGEFIPVFEENGFIYELDKYVWEEACAHLRKWMDEGRHIVPVSVNISRYDIFRPGFVEFLSDLIEKYALSVELLRLEITESAFAQSTSGIVGIVKQLIDLGFVVEIDDFGSGYSSLNTLKCVPAQVVKLDMRFLEDDNDAERGGNILGSIVRMTKWLGMSVIAEGVEDKAQADYLASIGCSYIQGFYYSKPLPLDRYEAYCDDFSKEQRVLAMNTVENLNNNAFWDPQSMDTLIFSSFVGGACIFEYHEGEIELLRANKKFSAILGDGTMTIEETLKLNWISCLAPESRRLVRSVLKRSFETKEEYTNEYVFLNIPGAPAKTYLRGTLRVIAATGSRWLVYCTSENITAQREAEENEKRALVESEKAAGQIQAILDNVDVGIVASINRVDRTELLFANERYFDLLGYTKEQFDAEICDPYDTFAPEDVQRVRAYIDGCIARNESGVLEAYMLRRDGSVRLIRDAFSTCRFAGIELPVQLSIYRDITGEREAELREKRSAEQISAIMYGVRSGITAAILNDQNVVEPLFGNDRYYELIGYTREQYQSEVKDAFDLIHPDERDSVKAKILEAYAARQPAQIEYRVICRDGTTRWLRVDMSSTSFSGVQQNIYLCVFNDITEVHESNRKLLETDEQLRFLVSMSHELLAQPDTERGIDAALNRLMTYFLGSHAYIFEIDSENGRISNTYETCGEGVHAQITDLQNLPLAPLRHWIEAFERDGCYAVFDVAALDDSRAEERARMLDRNIASLFVVPLRRDGKLIGMMGVDNLCRKVAHYSQLIALGDYISVMLTRRDLERRIGKERAELTTMMSDMPGGLVRLKVNANGTFTPVFCNEGFTKLVGMSESELMQLYSTSVLDAVHTDDVAVVKGVTEKLLKSGETHSSRFRLRNAHGGYLWVSTVERATRDGAGDVFLNIYFADATEQMLEEEHQKALMDNLPCGAGIYEFADGQISLTYQNRIYWELVGLNEEAFPDESEMSAVHPDDIPVIMQELSSAIERRRDVMCDIRLRHLTRGYRLVHLLGRVVFKETGGFLIYATFAPADREDVSYQQILPLLLSAMMNSSTEIFFAKDTDLRYLCASRAFVELIGLHDAAEIIGKTDADIFAAEKADAYRREDTALLNGVDALHDIVEAIPSADNRQRYINTSKFALRDGVGKQIAIFGVIRDLTEAKTNASRLELLTNNLPGGIATFGVLPGDPGKIHMTYFSDGFCRQLGYTRSQFIKLLSDNPFAIVLPEDIPVIRLHIAALLDNGEPAECVFRVRRSDGATRWIEGKAVAGEPEGQEISLNAVFYDVTEQREALEKLRMSEEVNRLAIQQSMSVVCQYDISTRQLTVPDNVDAIFNAEKVEYDIPYKPVREERVSPDTADAYIAFYESILRGEKKGVARFKRISTQGWRWIEAHFTTIYSDRGDPTTAVISIFDVTENIEKDAAYKKWKQSIKDRAPDAYSLFRCNITRSLVLDTSEGLLIPDERLEKTMQLDRRNANYADVCVYSEDRLRYLSFMNRDALLLRYSLGRRSDAIDYRERLPEGGYRWLRLSVDFMDSPYSSEVEAFMLFENIDEAKRAELAILERAEKDQLTGVLNRSNFIAKVEQMIEQRKRGTLSALFIIDLDGFKLINDHFGHAVGDETLIEIGQKLSNAFRDDDLICRLGGDEFMVYMGNVSFDMAIQERASLICALLHKSFSLEIQLSASIGISVFPNDGDDFETLYRKADAALYHVKDYGKDGYALYTGDMIVREQTSAAVEIEKTTPQDSVYAKPKPRMLIVDDSEINRAYLSRLFEGEYIVDTAAEGTTALARLKRYGAGIAIVLLDLVMPGVDGFAVLQRMRESVVMQNIPVIVVSGSDESDIALAAIRAGASDYVAKPVDAELLKLRVSSAISKAENEHLRAQNRYLAIQNEEAKRLAEARRHSEELSLALHAAEKADIAKSQFLSSMSHEIRTPLNAVIGYNTIARSAMTEAKSDEGRRQMSMKVLDCLTKSEVASRHLLAIINDVLDLSAIESGKLKVEGMPFDFRGLVTSLTVLFFSQARAKGVDFEVRFDKPTDEWLVGDQLRINQVLTNLLSNAVKFTPEGGSVTLTITDTIIDEKSIDFSFTVADTGIGMTQEYLEHIWTPFEQAETSIGRRFGGSGLGLSITKSLVDLMGGTISVESKSGVGSLFTVKLTLSRTEQPRRAVDIDFSMLNALVVDDDASTCDYIKLLFDRCGAKCVTYTSGQQAINAFVEANDAGTPFNMCLVDWRMPKMDGFTTISEIRRIAAKDMPIVVVTSYDLDEISDHAESLRINRFISKPLFQSSLFDLLSTVCGRQTVPELDIEPPQYDFSGSRVLLVEDNSMNMEVAKHLLQSVKLTVDCAWNGREAYDIILASKPGTYNVILMDVHMPTADGYEATRLIRGSGRADANTIPIIAMTADVLSEDIEQAREAGMNGHIAKPIDVVTLFETLAAYIDNRRQ